MNNVMQMSNWKIKIIAIAFLGGVFIMPFLLHLYDVIKYAKATDLIEVKITATKENSLKGINLQCISPKGHVYDMKLMSYNGIEMKGSQRIGYIAKMRISFNKQSIKNLKSIFIKIGDKEFYYDFESFSKHWIRIKGYLESPLNMYGKKSKIKYFNAIINWAGIYEMCGKAFIAAGGISWAISRLVILLLIAVYFKLIIRLLYECFRFLKTLLFECLKYIKNLPPKYLRKQMFSRHLLILISCSVIYAIIYLLITYPYRVFPSDDAAFLEMGKTNLTGKTYFPVFLFMVSLLEKIFGMFSVNKVSSILFGSVICNSVTILMSSLIVYRMTREILYAYFTIILYAFSAWMFNYYYFNSYTVFTAMFYIISLYALIEALARINESREDIYEICVLSGFFAGCCILSGSSSILLVGLEALLVFLLFFKNVKYIACFLIPLILSLSLFPSFIGELITHLNQNIGTDHYAWAMRKFGFIPKSPSFSFIRVIFYYSPILLLLFSTEIGVYVFMRIKNVLKYKYSLPEKILFCFLFLIIGHSFILDVLGTTKLARTHYPIYPILIMATILMTSIIIKNFRIEVARNLKLIVALVLIVNIFPNYVLMNKIKEIRCGAAVFLEKYYNNDTLFLLKEDPHAGPINEWLVSSRKLKIRIVPTNELIKIIDINRKSNIKTNLLIGPDGINSGKISMLNHRIEQDFGIPEFIKNLKVSKILPYYSSFPSFALEEEVMGAWFFSGKLPDNNTTNRSIKLYVI